jgi:nucleoside-diphosphate-sugar epimerase
MSGHGRSSPDCGRSAKRHALGTSRAEQLNRGQLAVAKQGVRDAKDQAAVPRPGDGAGLISAFMSQLFWKFAAGEPIVLPVSADGTAWWISVGACADNLLHAAAVDTSRLDARRVVQMPALHLAVGAVIDALARRHGEARRALVRHEPQDAVQRLFASYPPLHTPQADALGFSHDGSADALVQRATRR